MYKGSVPHHHHRPTSRNHEFVEKLSLQPPTPHQARHELENGMSSYLRTVTTSKSIFQKKLTQKSIEEKLTLLDRLAERSQLIRDSRPVNLSVKPS